MSQEIGQNDNTHGMFLFSWYAWMEFDSRSGYSG